ncbi:MAG: SDR family oxidoreductase [Phycisphaeraceae bacterium]
MTGHVLILGATSGIARAIASRLAAQRQPGHKLILAGRDMDEVNRIATDLQVRHGAEVSQVEFDALAFDRHAAFFAECVDQSDDNLTGVVLCYGTMADQDQGEYNFEQIHRMIEVNYSSAVSILNLAAQYFEQKRQGFICALSSVAADRGRPSNYLYGSTKAALSTYLEGLRARLAKAGVHVVTVKPGPVDTAMTWGLAVAGPLADPDRVAADVCRAIRKRKNVVYSPWFWRPIMAAIRMIPQCIFKRMKL